MQKITIIAPVFIPIVGLEILAADPQVCTNVVTLEHFHALPANTRELPDQSALAKDVESTFTLLEMEMEMG